MKILLIAGHGGTDPGACAYGRRECDLARELVTLLQKALIDNYGVDAAVYNMTRSAYHDIIALGYKVNFKQYDYVFEVHFNAYENDPGNGKVKGSEIHVTESEDVVTVESVILANMARLGFVNRGIKRKKWSVITEAKRQGVSSALFEVCFIDDIDDMKLYIKNKQAVADAVADGIAAGFKLERRCNMAGFKDISGHWAQKEIEKLKNQGIVGGYADGTFRPDKPVTRAEVCSMLAKVLDKVK